MLTMIEGLPDHVIGIRITDKLRAEDYETQLIPLVNEKLASHQKLDLLCCIEGEWKGMEAGAVWQDLRLGLGRIGHWARMAIVSDIKWMENAIKLFRLFSPDELRHFGSANYEVAREWVCELERASIRIALDSEAGILVLEPVAGKALSEDDFEAVGKTISSYLGDHDRLRGVLIYSRQFPGWQSVGALFAHLKFVNSVHDKISKIALVTSSPMGTFADHILDPLMLAKVRKFEYDQRDEAMSWLQS
ncbi:STAS/SEC14 domain-containing protein [Rhodanobacter sp. Col0626]|uniref:STAS/SEC14 domain-containing protein n=1 Tax=Rhodanobacter sp. Col0626 TaxID=3415679 RepID=UPI003CE82507